MKKCIGIVMSLLLICLNASAQRKVTEKLQDGSTRITTFNKDGSRDVAVKSSCTVCNSTGVCAMCGGSGQNPYLPGFLCVACSGLGYTFDLLGGLF